jgi:hypothetical protein
VLESWIADRPFREAHPPAQSDLDVARGTHAREILQDHWRNWIVESDWAWLAETGINAVRIPVSLLDPVDPIPAPGTQVRPYILLPGAFISPRRFTAPLWSPGVSRLFALAHNLKPLAFLSCPRAFSTHYCHPGRAHIYSGTQSLFRLVSTTPAGPITPCYVAQSSLTTSPFSMTHGIIS